MRIGLVGTVESSAAVLRRMISIHPPEIVVTLPFSKSGRHSDYADLRPLADGSGTPLFEASDINAATTLEVLRSNALDYLFVMGWSQICRRPILELPRRGCLGLHPSLLPKLRGRAVIPWTILLGLKETGLSLFWLADGPDTGDIHSQQRVVVDSNETARSLYDKHLEACDVLISACLEELLGGKERRIPQDHSEASYCARRIPDDGFINWTRPAEEVCRLIRATSDPYPGAFTTYHGSRLIIWTAELVEAGSYIGVPGQVHRIDAEEVLVSCGSGLVRVCEVQLADRPRGAAAQILPFQSRLGSRPAPRYDTVIEDE